MLIGTGRHRSVSAAAAYTMAAAIANEFSEATTNLYLSALFEVGLILFVITCGGERASRLMIWRVARARPWGAGTVSVRRGAAAWSAARLTSSWASCPFVAGRPAGSSWAPGRQRRVLPRLELLHQESVPAGASACGVANAIVGTAIVVGLAASSASDRDRHRSHLASTGRAGSDGCAVRGGRAERHAVHRVGIFADWLVKRWVHFSALPAAWRWRCSWCLCCARTPRTMVRLVPHPARAALALGTHGGAPRSASWRARRRWNRDGSLVGIARVAGRTAPLLFTALATELLDQRAASRCRRLSLRLCVRPRPVRGVAGWPGGGAGLMGLFLILPSRRWALRSPIWRRR